MSAQLIEAIALAVEECGPIGCCPIDERNAALIAQAALTGITEAGYAVVPAYPDLDTMLGMMKAANEADCGDLTITSARAALAYLISAAQGGE